MARTVSFSTEIDWVKKYGLERLAEVAESHKDHSKLQRSQYREEEGGVSVISVNIPAASEIPLRSSQRDTEILEKPRLRG